ncbi:MAG: ferric reductase-like transmembrane domain-containing protein [Thermodesulfobacteriota bacterium]
MQRDPLHPAKRRLWALLFMLGFCLLVSLAVSIPVSHQSSSMLYKFGWDRVSLRSGKTLGILSGLLLMVQLLLASRIKVLDRIFGLDKLLKTHRGLGLTVLVTAGLHPLLVFLPEGGWTVPFRLDHWPEYLGVVLLLGICSTVLLALFFKSLGLRFERWWLAHRLGTPLLMVFMGLHALNVSESFAKGFPRNFLLSALTASALVWIWVRLRPFRIRGKAYTVDRVTPAADRTAAVGLESAPGRDLAYAPGQFGFVRFRSRGLSREEHPFTLASNPADKQRLEFIIRASGDWTSRIPNLTPGETACIDGPYGLFSYLCYPDAAEFVFIAGGVGVTPFLSMLRHMESTRERRAATLIWSNRTRSEMILGREMDRLEQTLPALRLEKTFTREPGGRKLDRRLLEQLLEPCSIEARCFVCGPPRMMKDMRTILLSLGFSGRRIHQERFAL